MLFGAGLVKDEADVLEANIRHALTFCDRVIYMDNGSTDDSWAIVETMASEHPGRVIPFERTTEPYVEGMRNRIVNEFATELGDGGWWLKLDADEFLATNPRQAIASAECSGATAVRAWQIQFAFTDIDEHRWNAGLEDPTLPVTQRRRYYRLDWRECRLFRNRPHRPWLDVTRSTPEGIESFGRVPVFNRHYQHRDPEQMQRRLELRRGDDHFPHEQHDDWHSAIRPASRCHFHVDGEPWIVDWRLFVSNKALARARQLRAA